MLALGIVLLFLSVWGILGFFLSAKQIETGTIGVVRRFKKFNRVLEDGLKFTWPFPIETVQIVDTETHEDEFPTEPELVQKFDQDNVAAGKKPPFRIPQKDFRDARYYIPVDPAAPDGDWKTIEFKEYIQDHPERLIALEKDALSVGLTPELPYVVEWYLDKGSIENYIRNAKNDENVRKRLSDTVEASLQEFLGITTASHAASDGKPFIDRTIEKRLKVLVGQVADSSGVFCDKPWGIVIRRGFMKSLDPGKTVNEARSRAGAAVSDKNAEIEKADGLAQASRLKSNAEAANIRVLAEANADAEVIKGEGEAGRIAVVASTISDYPSAERVLQIEAFREVLPTAHVVFAPTDLGSIGGVLALGKELEVGRKGTSTEAL